MFVIIQNFLSLFFVLFSRYKVSRMSRYDVAILPCVPSVVDVTGAFSLSSIYSSLWPGGRQGVDTLRTLLCGCSIMFSLRTIIVREPDGEVHSAHATNSFSSQQTLRLNHHQEPYDIIVTSIPRQK